MGAASRSDSKGVAGGARGLETFLTGLRQALLPASGEVRALFDVFANEARFARAWLDPDLSRLDRGSRILEVGAGTLLLSSALQQEGFHVTALEPLGVGFSVLEELQDRVLGYSRIVGCEPSLISTPVEQLVFEKVFPLAFSFNVMEHVNDVEVALERIVEAVAAGGSYVFTCPNYWFPYEPHLNIPTLLSKSLTERAFRNAIRTSSRVSDPLGTWQSLNWINVGMVRRVVSRMEGVSVRFRRDSLSRALERAAIDPLFAGRRPAWMRSLMEFIVRPGFHRLAVFVPVSMQPTIDCRIQVEGR